MFNNIFFSEAKSFIHRQTNLTIDFAVGIGIFVAQFAGRMVRWIKELVGTTKKVTALQQAILQPTSLSNSEISATPHVVSDRMTSSERTQEVALPITSSHTSAPSGSKSGYVLEEYYSPIAANGDHLKVKDIDPRYLYVTYDNYAFDIRDVVDFVERITEGQNINPHKTEDIANRFLWKPRSLFSQQESYFSLAELMVKEQEALGTHRMIDVYNATLKSDQTAKLQALKAQLQPSTISMLMELSYVLSQENIENRSAIRYLQRGDLIEKFLDRHAIDSPWDALSVRTIALREIKDFLQTLPQPEKEALLNSFIERYTVDPTIGTYRLRDMLTEALRGTFCMEHLGTSLFKLCDALEAV